MPKLPGWKVRALQQCETGVYDKIFLKYADDVQPFWDPTEWFLYVDSERVTPQTNGGRSSNRAIESRRSRTAASQLQQLEQYDRVRLASPAMRNAQKRRDPYSRGYYTVRTIMRIFVCLIVNRICK